MNRLNITSKDKIAIIRSAHIGDFIVCLPLVYNLIAKNGLSPENVYFIIINDSGLDPVAKLFGNNYFPDDNIFVISNDRNILNNIYHLKNGLPLYIDHVCYLPFKGESMLSVLKKRAFLKVVFGITKQIYGANVIGNTIEHSQYYSLLERYSYSAEREIDYLHFLGLYECGVINKVNDLLVNNGMFRVAIYPNSKLKMKVWPKNKYISLVDHLIKTYNAAVYLVGGDGDFDYNQQILNSFTGKTVTNIAGVLTIREMIMFMKQMNVVIGNDGAPLHMASLAKVPIVGLYTYKAPIGMWDPVLSDKVITLRKNVNCRCCNRDYCNKPYCLIDVSVHDVIVGVKEILSQNFSGCCFKVL